jgi:NADPH:quinone reductase-like Zn-dependent oxidoreductase
VTDSRTPRNCTPFIVVFGGSVIVESVPETNADEQTRELLNKQGAFLADSGKDGSYAQCLVCDRRLAAVLPDEVPFHQGLVYQLQDVRHLNH